MVCVIEGDGSNKILAKPHIWLPIPGQIGRVKGRCTHHSELADTTGTMLKGNSKSPCPSFVSPRWARKGRKKGTHSQFCVLDGCLSVGSLSCLRFLPLPLRKTKIYGVFWYARHFTKCLFILRQSFWVAQAAFKLSILLTRPTKR